MSKSRLDTKEIKKNGHKGLIVLIVFFSLIFLVIIAVLGAYYYFFGRESISIRECWEDAIVTIDESSSSDFVMNKTTRLYNANGDIMLNLSNENSSSYLTYNNIPEDAVNAFVAVEDNTFWTNNGYSAKGIARALINDVLSGSNSQGGSTITQQLCKLTYLSNEKSLERKIKEIFLAYQMTLKYSKEQIMEWYVNSCCFANGIYGLKDAAAAYMDKDVDELSLSEICYLCAIPNSPEYYNPWKEPENALERRDVILASMYDCGYITEGEWKEALDEDVHVTSGAEETTYDFAATYAINCATEVIMENDGFEFKNDFSNNAEYKEYNEEYDEAYADAKNKLYSEGYSIYTSIEPDVQAELQKCVDEELEFSSDISKNNVFNLQGSAVVINNERNKIIAVVGGRSEEEINAATGYNRAYQYARQPGSAIKPLICYIPALEEGYNADSKLREVDVDKAYEAYHSSEEVTLLKGDEYSLRYSVEHSLNGAALYLYSVVTPEVGMQYLLDMGFSNIVPDDYYLSAVLGGFTYGTNTLEMANAYNTVANYGEYNKADCIVSMLDNEGNEVYTAPDPVQVYDSNACVEMTDIMEGVLSDGTAKELKWSSYTDEPAAGKTGTTNDSVDGWFCGYTSDYTVSVWVGTEDNSEIEGLSGGSYPAKIWENIMLWLTENKPLENGSDIFNATYEETEGNVPYISDNIWHLNQAAYVRDAPSSTNSNIIYTMAANTDVNVVEMGEYWTQINVDGTLCYIYTPFLSPGSVENH